MNEYNKPLPAINDENRPFWDGCRAHRLMMQKCRHCSHIRYPIQAVCPECLSEEVDWIVLSGRGEVLSRMVFHRAYHPGFKEDIPYNVVLVQLDEGPRIFSNVVGVDNAAVQVGMEVAVVFDDVTPEVTIPRFTPRLASSQ